MEGTTFKAIIVGAGPAGLTAAYELSKHHAPVVVLESDPNMSVESPAPSTTRTSAFDIGGHRFFSKSREVEDFGPRLLATDMLDRPRSSRIYYRGQFYTYPLKPFEALSKLGLIESVLCMLSFLKARLNPTRDPKTFEDWVTNQFGKRLFRIFFKTYTEKVWGMSCSEISADWAAQRIKGPVARFGHQARTFAGHETKRPQANREDADRHLPLSAPGPGMMWEACAEKVRKLGGEVLLGRKVVGCRFDSASNLWVVTTRNADGEIGRISRRTPDFIHAYPRTGGADRTTLPEAALQAARSLRYRDFLTVGLIVHDRGRFTDNWIYIHDPSVQVGRVQNYKSWSPEMVPDPAYCSYGLEYFCFEGDGLWNTSDRDLIELAKKEIQKVNLAASADVVDGCVIRQPKAYPVYDDAYQQHVIRFARPSTKTVPRFTWSAATACISTTIRTTP
jgi:protoporphyrinogen oxidase